MSYILEWPHRNDHLRELKNLQKQVNDLKIKLRGRNRKRVRKGSSDDPDYALDSSSRGNGSHQLRD